MSLKCEFCDTLINHQERRCPSCGATPSGVPQQQVSHQPPTPIQQEPQKAMLGVSPKNRLVAGLLGILIGGLGIHNFYLGFKTKGVIQLVLTITVFFWWAAAIWGLVEGIIILTSKDPKDAEGLTLVFS